MNLSNHFTLAEFTRSTTAEKHGIDNTPEPATIQRLRQLCENVLEPLRVHYGRAIRINSGYRCQELNQLVGGAASSHHCKGCAADISAGSPEENKKLFEWIAENSRFTQLIDEKNFTWVHVSYIAENLKGQILKIS